MEPRDLGAKLAPLSFLLTLSSPRKIKRRRVVAFTSMFSA